MPTENQWDFDDESQNNNTNNQQQQNQGSGLRVQLERALAENKTLKESVQTLTKQVRETTVSAHIKDKGLNPKISKLIPSDVESTKEALDAWFEENADLFPATGPKEGQGEQPQGEVEETLEQDDNDMAWQSDRMANVANAGRIPGRQEDVIAKLRDPNLTPEKLMELITAAGGGVGSG